MLNICLLGLCKPEMGGCRGAARPLLSAGRIVGISILGVILLTPPHHCPSAAGWKLRRNIQLLAPPPFLPSAPPSPCPGFTSALLRRVCGSRATGFPPVDLPPAVSHTCLQTGGGSAQGLPGAADLGRYLDPSQTPCWPVVRLSRCVCSEVRGLAER